MSGSREHICKFVSQAAAGDPAALLDVCRFVTDTCRVLLARFSPEVREDLLQTVVYAVLASLSRGCVQEPRYFKTYVWRTCQLTLLNHWREVCRDHQSIPLLYDVYAEKRPGFNPDDALVAKTRYIAIVTGLAALDQRDREIIVRFYLLDQPQDLIQRAMRITQRQFALNKSRALAKLRALVNRQIDGSPRGGLQALAAAA